MGDNRIVLIRKSAITLAAVLTAAVAAHGGEPGGFRPGLFAGEVGGALFASTPSVAVGTIVLVRTWGAT